MNEEGGLGRGEGERERDHAELSSNPPDILPCLGEHI